MSASDVDLYISAFPIPTRNQLELMRQTIRDLAPEAEEVIGYGIPTFKLNGNLVHYGGFKTHIGFYPGPSGLIPFQNELANYKQSKGSVQFAIDQPLPLKLIVKIVAFRMQENLAKKKKT